MKQAVLPTALVLALCLSGCGSKDLTRSRAKNIIEGLDVYKLKTQQVVISDEEVNALTKAGYLKWQGFGMLTLVVTQNGKQYFDNAKGEVAGFMMPGTKYIVVPTVPMKPEIIEITGITGGGDTTGKQGENHWHWLSSSQPGELRKLIPSLAAGKRR